MKLIPNVWNKKYSLRMMTLTTETTLSNMSMMEGSIMTITASAIWLTLIWKSMVTQTTTMM